MRVRHLFRPLRLVRSIFFRLLHGPRRVPPAFTLIDRLFALRAAFRPAALRRPARLSVLSLEDRTMPTAVGPGGYWDDGHYDAYGNKVGVTVTLSNSGPGWVEVSGGGGAVSVSPGSPPSYGSGSGYPTAPPVSPPAPGGGYGSGSGSGPGSGYGSGSGSGPGSGPTPAGTTTGSGSGSGGTTVPNPPNYAFSVSGALGDGSGDVTWSGGADSLYINATGDVSPVSIGGDLYVQAGWTIGALSGRDVSAQAGKSIASAAASDDVNSLTAGTSIGTVTAADDIVTVSAGTTVGNATAGGDVGSVSAGKSTGSVTAGGDVGTVSAGLDVGGSVSAGGDIGGVRKTTDGWVGVAGTYYGGGGVSAGRNVAGSVSAAGNIAGVRAGGRVQGSVTAAAGDIFWVSGGGGYAYSEGTGSGSPPVPYAGGVLGPVTAGRDVRVVSAVNGDVVGSVSANRDVLAVNADGSVVGGVGAKRHVGKADTPAWTWAWLPSNPSYWPYWGWVDYAPLGGGVHAKTGAVSGSVTADTGDVTFVSAGAQVSGAVTAEVDIGGVTGDTGVSGAVDAGRDVGWVSAGSGSGYYGGSGYGSGGSADVSGPVTAGRNIDSVSASGSVTAAVDAGHGIGGVTAGGDVTGAVTAGAAVGRTDDVDPHLAQSHPYWSSYDSPYWGAGVRAGGSVTGTVDAGTDVSRVEAGGMVQGPITAGRDVGFVHGTTGVSAPIDAGRDVGRVYAGGYGWVSTYSSSYWGELPGGAVGSVSGTVDAPSDVYGVYATGDLSGAVTAGGGVADVSAKGSVTGDITAADSVGFLGGLGGSGMAPVGMYYGGVTAGVDVAAAVDAGGDVTFVRAGQDLGGSVDAGRDIGSARAGRDVTATLTAGRDIGAISAGRLPGYVYPTGSVPGVTGSVTGDATAGRNIRSVTATGDVDAAITAGHAVGGVYAQGDIGGSIEATTGPIGRLTDEPVYDPYGSLYYAFPYSSEADAPGKVHADGDIDAAITAGGDITRVDAKGDISGTIMSGRDIAAVTADHSIDADISADRDIADVTAGVDPPPGYYDYGTGQWVQPPGIVGDITGSVAAGRDLTRVKATGSIDADISAGHRVTTIRADLDISGSVDAGEDVVLVTAGRHMHATVHAGRDVREVRAGTAGTWEWDPDTGEYGETGGTPGDVTGDVSADRDMVSVSATRDVTGGVTGTHAVGRVAGGGSVTGDVTATEGAVGRLDDADPHLPWYLPYAYYYLTPNPYLAGGIQGGVHAGLDVSGAVTAGTDVSMVEGLEGAVSGAIDAGRDVGWVHGTTGVSSEITAGRDVGAVYAGAYEVQYGGSWVRVEDTDPADFTGSVTAAAGVATVEATGSVLGDVTAGDSIGYLGPLTQDPGDEPDGEDRHFGAGVWAGLDVDAAVDAGGDVHAVTAGRDIAGFITAGRDVCALDAPRDLTADVDASRDVGNVSAGRDITGTITAGRDIGAITSGYYAGGSIEGDVTAGRDIVRVTAYGGDGNTVSEDLARPEDGLTFNISAEVSYDAKYVVLPFASDAPDGPDLIDGGNVSGNVHAHRRIGPVVAIGKIEGNITAGDSLGHEWGTQVNTSAEDKGVWALQDITGDITSGADTLTVRTWGREDGDVSGVDQVQVWSFDEMTGAISSSESGIRAGSWNDLTASAEAVEDVEIWSFKTVGPGASFTSSEWTVKVAAGEDLDASANAAFEIVALAQGDITGDFTTGNDIEWAADAALWAGGSVDGATVTSTGSITVGAWSDVTVTATGGNRVWVYSASGSVDGCISSTLGDVWVEGWEEIAATIAGAAGANAHSSAGEISGTVSSSDGYATAEAWKSVTGDVTGASEANVYSTTGGVSGTVNATDGEAWVDAWLDVTGNVSGKIGAWVSSFGGVSGSVTSSEGYAWIDAWGDVTGNVSGYADAWVYTALGRVTGAIDSPVGETWVEAYGDVTGNASGASGVWVWTYGQSSGSVTSSEGYAWIDAWGDVTGNVSGYSDVWVDSWGSVTGDVTATAGEAWVDAFGDVSGDVSGRNGVWITSWEGGVTGTVTSAEGTSWVDAWGNVSANVSGRDGVWVDTWGGVSGSVTSSGGYAWVDAWGDVTGNVSGYFDAWVESWGSVTGNVTATAGEAKVDAWGDVSGTVVGTAGATVQSWYGAVSGQITSSAGDVDVEAWASITGSIHAYGEVNVTSYGDVGDSGTTIISECGSVTVQADGDVDGIITAGVNATIVAGGLVTASVVAGESVEILAGAEVPDGDAIVSVLKSMADMLSNNYQNMLAGMIVSDMDLSIMGESPGEPGSSPPASPPSGSSPPPASPPPASPPPASPPPASPPNQSVTDRLNEAKARLDAAKQGVGQARLADRAKLPFNMADNRCAVCHGSINGEFKNLTMGGVRLEDLGERQRMMLDLMATGRKIGPKEAFEDFLNTIKQGISEIPGQLDQVFGLSTGPADPDVVQMSAVDRLVTTLRIMIDEGFVEGELKTQVEGLLTTQNIAILSALVGAHFIPGVGQVVDVIAGVVGYALLGAEAVKITADLAKFVYLTLNGRTHEDLANAAQALSEGLVKAAIAAGTTAAVAKFGKTFCFLPGTLVHAENGNKPIENIVAGDRVWACDPATGEWELCKVLDQWGHDHSDEVVTIYADGVVVQATSQHPFWVMAGERLAERPVPGHISTEELDLDVPTGRWVGASDLAEGDVLSRVRGRKVRIERLVRDHRTCVVYNLHVEKLHTYAVAEAGILVHNAGGTDAIKGKLKEKVTGYVNKVKGKKGPEATPSGKTPPAPVKVTPPEHATLKKDPGNGMTPEGRTMDSVGALEKAMEGRVPNPPVNDGTWVAHHVIPGSLYRDVPVLREIGFRLNYYPNGVWLPKSFHPGKHEYYTRALKRLLDDIKLPANPTQTDLATAAQKVEKVMDAAKSVLKGRNPPLRYADAKEAAKTAGTKLTPEEFTAQWEAALRGALK